MKVDLEKVLKKALKKGESPNNNRLSRQGRLLEMRWISLSYRFAATKYLQKNYKRHLNLISKIAEKIEIWSKQTNRKTADKLLANDRRGQFNLEG